jgi:hypothetical protein
MPNVTRKYEDYICPERLRPSSITNRDLPSEILSDKARVVTSTAFRRLQAKAQVFSLEQNAAVRTCERRLKSAAGAGRKVRHLGMFSAPHGGVQLSFNAPLFRVRLFR